MPPPPQGAAQKSPLDVLPSMLHAVFIQTANVFNDPRKHNPRAVVNTNAMIRLGIPAAIDRFQYALDCLEVEILRAKATFRRDLEILRQNRAEEEAKANAEREAEADRIKAETAARERQEREEKHALREATADQVAAANRAEEEKKRQELNSGLTDTWVNQTSISISTGNVKPKVPTPPPAIAPSVNEDIDMLFDDPSGWQRWAGFKGSK